MTDIGEFIKKQRIAKGLSQEELASGIMSKAYLSKVERGENILASDKLMKVLDRLNNSLHEFNLHLTTTNGNNQIDFLNRYQFARKDNNRFLLNKILNQEIKFFNESKNIRHHHNSIIVKQKLLQLEHKPFDKLETSVITEYIYSLNEWYYYDLTVFSNSLFFLPFDFVFFFSKNIFKKTEKIFKNHVYKNEVFLLTINIISNFIRSNHIDEALQFITEIEKQLDQTNFYYQINKLMFLRGICYIKKDKISLGKDISEKALNIMYEMKDFTNVRIHQDILDEALNSH